MIKSRYSEKKILFKMIVDLDIIGKIQYTIYKKVSFVVGDEYIYAIWR